MRALHHPDVSSVDLATILNALADPVRLSVIGQLADSGGVVRGGFDVPVSMSTLSHHLKVLREAGLVRVTPDGSCRRHELRVDEVDEHYPGVLGNIVRNIAARSATAR